MNTCITFWLGGAVDVFIHFFVNSVLCQCKDRQDTALCSNVVITVNLKIYGYFFKYFETKNVTFFVITMW